jgi:hypothetical protein
MQASSSAPSSSRPHRGRGDHRPCDYCRTWKTRYLMNRSLPCERCQRSGKVCSFNQEPPARRRTKMTERDSIDPSRVGFSETPPPLEHSVTNLLSPSANPESASQIGRNSSLGGLNDFLFNWDFF